MITIEALFIGYLVIQAFRSDGWRPLMYALGALGLAMVVGAVGWSRPAVGHDVTARSRPTCAAPRS